MSDGRRVTTRNIILLSWLTVTKSNKSMGGGGGGGKAERTRCESKGRESALKKHVSDSVIRHRVGRFVDVDDKRIQPTAPCAFKRDNAHASYGALYSLAHSPKKPLFIPSGHHLPVSLPLSAALPSSFAVQPLNTGPTRRSNEFPITPDATVRITG